jgi:hypothetical protein
MRIRVYRSKVKLPLVKVEGEKQQLFHIAERKENGITTAFSLMDNKKGK